MVTVAAPLSICHRPTEMLSDGKVETRKRRREVRATQRGGTSSSDDDDDDDDDVVTNSSSDVVLANSNFTEANKRMKATTMNSGASIDCSYTNEPLFSFKKSTSIGKKQQMKYDPDVPMTKEEAAKWRREQRRKRNRESAAASRQRQRDRITELEVHVEDWKSKFEDVMARIAHLEKLKKQKSSSSLLLDADSSKNNIPLNSKSQLIGSDSDDDDNIHIHHHIHQPDVDPVVDERTIVGMDMDILPLSSISHDSPVIIASDAVISASSAISLSSLLDTPVPNPLSSFDITSRATPIGIVPVSGDEEEDMLLPSNMISRPAALLNNHSFHKN